MKKIVVWMSAMLLAQVSYAANAPTDVRMSLQLVKNTTPLWQYQIIALEGRSTPIGRFSEVTFIKACEVDQHGRPVLSPGQVATGDMLDVTRDGEMFIVTLNHSALERISVVAGKDGCETQRPETSGFSVTSSVKLKQGETVELPASVGSDKYTLIVNAL